MQKYRAPELQIHTMFIQELTPWVFHLYRCRSVCNTVLYWNPYIVDCITQRQVLVLAFLGLPDSL